MLVKLNFTEGQMVKAGDLLAQIDPRPYQAALDQSRGPAGARFRPTSPTPRSTWRAIRPCSSRTRSPTSRWRRRKSLVKSDDGVVVADQANVETAASISAIPASSRRWTAAPACVRSMSAISSPPARPAASWWSPSSSPCRCSSPCRKTISTRSWRGSRSGATLPADAYDRSQTTKLASGTLATVDNVVDPTTGTVKLRAMFDNTDNKLFPSPVRQHPPAGGHAAEPDRGAGGGDPARRRRHLRLRRHAGQDRDPAHRHSRACRTATTSQILSGVKPGDTVVVDGADRLRDGADVEIPNQTGQDRRAFGRRRR